MDFWLILHGVFTLNVWLANAVHFYRFSHVHFDNRTEWIGHISLLKHSPTDSEGKFSETRSNTWKRIKFISDAFYFRSKTNRRQRCIHFFSYVLLDVVDLVLFCFVFAWILYTNYNWNCSQLPSSLHGKYKSNEFLRFVQFRRLIRLFW